MNIIILFIVYNKSTNTHQKIYSILSYIIIYRHVLVASANNMRVPHKKTKNMKINAQNV